MKIIPMAAFLSLFAMTHTLYAEIKPQKPITSSNQVTQLQKIDLNKADLATLSGSFKGIGKKRAEAIIAYRESHKGFKSLEELAEVRGLGQHFVDSNREKLQAVYVVK